MSRYAARCKRHGPALDQQRSAARSGKDALLVVVEMDVAHGEIVALDPDAGAVPVAHFDARALDAVDHHVIRFDHQRRLALNGMAAEMGARLATQDQGGRLDHRALLVDPRREHDLIARQGGCDRFLQALVATLGLAGGRWADAQGALVATGGGLGERSGGRRTADNWPGLGGVGGSTRA
jgi:hypothetical protein